MFRARCMKVTCNPSQHAGTQLARHGEVSHDFVAQLLQNVLHSRWRDWYACKNEQILSLESITRSSQSKESVNKLLSIFSPLRDLQWSIAKRQCSNDAGSMGDKGKKMHLHIFSKSFRLLLTVFFYYLENPNKACNDLKNIHLWSWRKLQMSPAYFSSVNIASLRK